jgi:hypothetical protein
MRAATATNASFLYANRQSFAIRRAAIEIGIGAMVCANLRSSDALGTASIADPAM